MRNKLLYAFSALIIGWLSLAPVATAAANDFNLTTSPLPIDLTTTPGKPISTQLRVQNSGNQPITLKVSLKKFKAYGSTGNPQIEDCTAADDFCSWVSFSKTSILAQPGQWYNVGMTIAPPKDSGFGYYYAVIFSNANPGKAASARSNVLTGATATLVLLNVDAPGEKRELKLKQFSLDKKFYEYLPANFSVSLRNSGNIHLVPSGSIYISRGGKTIATLDVNPNGGNILPDSNRIYKVRWEDGFPVFTTKTANGQIVNDKQGQPVQQLKWNFAQANKLRFGHYSAHLVLTYSDGVRDIPLQADAGFWVVPWKLLLVFLVALAMALLGLWTAGRALVRKLNKSTPKKTES